MDAIDYYNKYASKVFEETVDRDTAQARAEFLNCLEEGGAILDLGCGSGRDSLEFYGLGYDVTPLDGSEEMCRLAEVHTDMEVLLMDFQEMAFEDAFDGIWANESLIHIPREEIGGVFERIGRALKKGGVFYCTVYQGDFEGFAGELYFCGYGKKELAQLAEKEGGLSLIRVWETEDREIPRSLESRGMLHLLARKEE